MALLSYPKYKDSGVEWLGAVPDHWEITRNKSYLKYRKDTVGDQSANYTLLSLTLKGIIKRDMENPQGKFPAEFNTYKIVKSGDLVFCLFDIDETPRTVGLSSFDGMITGAYDILYSNKQTVIDYLYLYYLSIDNVKGLKPLYSGLRKVVPKDAFMSMKIALPPEDEQILIVRYLKFINNKILKYISAKKKLIKLLEEQKQAVIHQAVTGAIDVKTGKPYGKYKNTGSEWLNKTPEIWESNKIKYVSKINPSITVPELKVDTQISFVPMENVNDKLGIISDYNLRIFSEVSKGYTSFNTGDIIFAKITPCMENGNCAIVGQIPYKLAFGSTEFIVIRPNINKVNPEFLHLVLRDKYFRIICESNMKGSAGQKRISSDFIGSYLITYPTLDYQKLIIKHIEKYNSILESGINKAKEEIALLGEYRTTVIANVVTGKVDVRSISNTLSDEIETVEETDKSDDDIIEKDIEIDENESN